MMDLSFAMIPSRLPAFILSPPGASVVERGGGIDRAGWTAASGDGSGLLFSATVWAIVSVPALKTG